MTKRRVLQMFAVLLVLLLAATVRSLPDVPPLPESLEQGENGWYWGEGQDSLAAAVPEEDGLTVFWVEKTQNVRLFYKKCKTTDPAEALKMAEKLPLYTPELSFDMDDFGRDEKLLLNAGMAALEKAGAQGNGGRWVDSYTLPKGTHKAGAALVMALVLEITPQQALESLEENLNPAVWQNGRLADSQDFHFFAGLVDLQWYYLWGTFANLPYEPHTDAAQDLFVIENAS